MKSGSFKVQFRYRIFIYWFPDETCRTNLLGLYLQYKLKFQSFARKYWSKCMQSARALSFIFQTQTMHAFMQLIQLNIRLYILICTLYSYTLFLYKARLLTIHCYLYTRPCRDNFFSFFRHRPQQLM